MHGKPIKIMETNDVVQTRILLLKKKYIYIKLVLLFSIFIISKGLVFGM